MKGKRNLEKAIVLGLLLSTSVYGSAWAEMQVAFPDDESVVITSDKTVTNDTKINHEGEEKGLGDFKNITIYFNPTSNENRALGVYSARYELQNSNITVHVGDEKNPGIYENADGLHLSNHFPEFYVRSYEAYIYGKSSDAINLSHDITTNSYVYIGNPSEEMGINGNGNLTAVVYDGNGIRANSSVIGNYINAITVGGTIDITLNGDTVTKTVILSDEELDKILGDIPIFGEKKVREQIKSMSATASYNPAAVYAGNDMYNFECDFKTLVEEAGVLDKLGSFAGLVTDILDNMDPLNMGSESKGKGVVILNDTNLTLNGGNNYGLFAGKNGSIEVNGNLQVNSIGNNSYGIAAKNANLIYGNEIIATAELDGIVGSVLGKDPISAELEINLDDSPNTYGTEVILNGDNNIINMQGNDSKAIYAEGVDANGNANTVKSGDSGIGHIEFVGDIVAENGGAITLDIKGNEQNYFQGDMIAFGTQDNVKACIDLKTNAALAYQGDTLAANGGTVDVTLGDGSFWSGRADDYQDAANPDWSETHISTLKTKFDGEVTNSGTVNMNLGTASIWNVTGQSWVTKLEGNDSVIIMDGEGTGGYALHVGDINGSNTFVMNISANGTGDMLYIKNGTNAQQNLVINNADEVLETMQVGDAIRFATVANSQGGFIDGEFVDMPQTGVQTFGNNTKIVDAGMFNVDFDIVYNDYDKTMDGDLASDDSAYNGDGFGTDKPGSDYVDTVYGGKNDETATNFLSNEEETSSPQNIYIVRNSVTKENLSDAGKTIINMSRANYKNAIYMDRLNKRLGEARYINGEEEQGMWVRLRHDRIGQSGDFRSMNTMYELGYDVKQDCDNGERRVGFAVDYMRGSTTYSDIMGKGETKRYGLWLYDTWLGDKGHYADYVLKWGHLSNDFDITAKSTLENITGDYSNNVFSVSAEYGKKNNMGSGWYFEPQAQLQLARVTGADYVSSQDTKVSVDGINSLIGRAGFRLGRDLNESSTVYLKADLLHEFLGDQTITAQDATGTLREEFENKGTWYDVGIGFAAMMSKNSYAFLDLEKSFGHDNDETYQINAGMQWTF